MRPIAIASYRHQEHGQKAATDIAEHGAWAMFRDLPVLVSFMLLDDNVVRYILKAPKDRGLEDQHGNVDDSLTFNITYGKPGGGKSGIFGALQEYSFISMSLTPGVLYTKDMTMIFMKPGVPARSAGGVRWSIPLQYGAQNMGFAKLDLVSIKIYRQKLYNKWAMLEKL